MAKKIILALVIAIIMIVFAMLFLINDTVDIYNDGENVSVETHTISDIDVNALNENICDYTINVMNDTTTDINEYKAGIGPDQIPIIAYVDGTSMLPTLQDGQPVLLNKTHDIKVGDIVVAESDEYGGIIKRVDDIRGNDVHLISDNKEISYEYINGDLYEVKGITTWVDISDIGGVVIGY